MTRRTFFLALASLPAALKLKGRTLHGGEYYKWSPAPGESLKFTPHSPTQFHPLPWDGHSNICVYLDQPPSIPRFIRSAPPHPYQFDSILRLVSYPPPRKGLSLIVD